MKVRKKGKGGKRRGRERRPPIHISGYATEKWPVQYENRDDVPGLTSANTCQCSGRHWSTDGRQPAVFSKEYLIIKPKRIAYLLINLVSIQHNARNATEH